MRLIYLVYKTQFLTFKWFVMHIRSQAMPCKLSIRSIPNYLWCGFILYSSVLNCYIGKTTANLPDHGFYLLVRHWFVQGAVNMHFSGLTLKGQKIACYCFLLPSFILYIVSDAAFRKLIMLVWIREFSQTVWVEETLESHWSVIR